MTDQPRLFPISTPKERNVEDQKQQPESWAIVEVMGHQRFAGRVSQDSSFGPALTRVDVPAVGDAPAFSKLFGAGSIYSITPCTEETAKAAAASFRSPPFDVLDLMTKPVRSIEYADDDERGCDAYDEYGYKCRCVESEEDAE